MTLVLSFGSGTLHFGRWQRSLRYENTTYEEIVLNCTRAEEELCC